jgi:RNA polymerase sigma factor (sigma-70 family)
LVVAFDEALLTALVARDEHAQARVYQVIYPQLMAEAGRVLTQADAEDVVQTAFAQFLSGGVDALRHPRAIPNFLKVLVRRRALDLIRLRQRRAAQADDIAAFGEVDRRAAPDHRLLTRDLARCLQALGATYQRTIAVLYLQDRSYRQAEAVLGVGRDTIGRRHKTALKALKICMEAKEDPNGT